jgi:uncharacterized RDD family membrane protein YckC
MKRFTWYVVLLASIALGRCEGLVAQTPEPPPLEQQIGAPAAEPPVEPEPPVERVDESRQWRQVLRIGQGYTLPAAEAVHEVVVILGDATIEGHVGRDVVVVLGRAHLASTASIDGALVVIGGTASAAAGATLLNDLIVIGGDFDPADGFTAGGQHVVIGPALLGLHAAGIAPWLTRGLLWGRLIVPDLQWVWWAVGLLFLVYLTVNLVFDYPVRACAVTLAERPLTAFIVGLLVLLLVGPVCLLLAVSVVGIAVIPVVIGAVVIAGMLGRIGVARWIGMRVVPQEAPENRLQALRSFVIGFAVITLAYMVPVLGFLTWTMLGVLGLGAAALTFIAGYRREHPAPPLPSAPLGVTPAGAHAVAAAAMAPSPHAVPRGGDIASTSMPSHADAAALATPASDLTTFPRAAFLDRTGAFVLDVVLVVIAQQLLDLMHRDSAIFLLLLAYHIGFWAWKGTTVGGIICQLRIVRVDGAPLRFVDALVRGLSSIFSLAVGGLGVLWILKDPERQAWHDRIAGTYVVRVPRNYPI